MFTYVSSTTMRLCSLNQLFDHPLVYTVSPYDAPFVPVSFSLEVTFVSLNFFFVFSLVTTIFGPEPPVRSWLGTGAYFICVFFFRDFCRR